MQTAAKTSPKVETRNGNKRKRKAVDESSDFNPEDDDEEPDDDHMSGSESPQKNSHHSEGSQGERRSTRLAKRRKTSGSENGSSEDLDQDELREEAANLKTSSRRKRADDGIAYESRPQRQTRAKDPRYQIWDPDRLKAQLEEEDEVQSTSKTRSSKSGYQTRSLFPMMGPFGGGGGPAPVFGGPQTAGAMGGANSDSSDDELPTPRPQGISNTIGMTPTTAYPPPIPTQGLNADPAQAMGIAGGSANIGKVKDKKALADADPLGVDLNVSFDGVGGLDNHVNQLKEMVSLPLLYPEVFQQFNVTPPRGVLFHGPPGTGKTLLARALASSVSSQGKKVSFYMRKGGDALSKWVGEAERALRTLFEEARKNQPSIIFFDEIDGIAPVRNNKSDSTHASVVATLLALMDGLDGRGQVIVIGATNRPDNVDPALRRPGRFDREFYFPLPDQVARRSIIDIHTRSWNPPLQTDFKDQLAALTKGYGGADLRALCTEAALNAVQGTYPQIYKSSEKLVIDPSKIKIQAKDFMISIDKVIPSSARSGSSGVAPLDAAVEPLLREIFGQISTRLDEMIPLRPKRTALEEAEFDDREDTRAFEKEMMQQDFDRSRVYRPRLLISGPPGMGQQYLAIAILHKFERLHVQSLDLPVLYSDTTRSPEAAVIQLFDEVKRRKPAVIYIPNVNVWYETVGPSVTKVLNGLLRSMPPNDPILVLGVMENENENDEDKPNENMMRDLFGFSTKNRVNLPAPTGPQRHEYFKKIVSMVTSSPGDLPNPESRKRRRLDDLEVAPAPAAKEPRGPTNAELKAQERQDLKALNALKTYMQTVMEQTKKYKHFRQPLIDHNKYLYLFDEQDPAKVSSDLPQEQGAAAMANRPYEISEDAQGVKGLYENATGKFYYNIDTTTMEKRLVNGYYKRPKDFAADIRRIVKDASTTGNEDRWMKANELLANVEVDMASIEDSYPVVCAMCEQIYYREKEREKALKKQGHRTEASSASAFNAPQQQVSGSTSHSTGPTMQGPIMLPRMHPVPLGPPIRRVEPSPLTNGDTTDHPMTTSNGVSHSTHDEDVQMGNTGADTVPQTQSAPQTDSAPQRSQKSALTAMAQNSQPGDYHNSASTTSSGQKTSDKSGGSSDPNRPQAQQLNGIHKEEHPTFSALREMSSNSELPDTQENANASSQSAPNSQMMGPPQPPQPTSIPAILNDDNTSTSSAGPTKPHLILDDERIVDLHKQLVEKSSGCSVEQIEQINAVLMDVVWRRREDWNRNLVAAAVKDAFNEVIHDIEEMQKIFPNSQQRENKHRRSGSGSGLHDSSPDGSYRANEEL